MLDAVDLFDLLVAQAERENAGAVVDFGATARAEWLNQGEAQTGNRIILVPSTGAPADNMLRSRDEFVTVAETWEVYCWAHDECDDRRVAHYRAAQRLSDVVARAFWPLQARIELAATKPTAPAQLNITGAEIVASYVVRRPISGYSTSAGVGQATLQILNLTAEVI
jgi:hypothetical protein